MFKTETKLYKTWQSMESIWS